MQGDEGMNLEAFFRYIDEHREAFLADLSEALRQPSIAAQGVGIEAMAALVEERLRRLGARVQRFVMEPGAPPILFAEMGAGERTLLFYNHYDVQPPDPVELWTSPPFEPTVRDGKLYARGVADDKGDLWARIQALEAWQATYGALPLRITWIIEGEEEVGSPHLIPFAQAHADLLRADGCLWETGEKDEADRPMLHLGVKGIAYFELRARGANVDLHSMYAAIVPNPAWRLVQALATLKDAQERILIPGFMELVREPSAEELAYLERIPFEEEALRRMWDIPAFVNGETGVTALKRLIYGPTCNICGINAGYTGEGGKTVLPSTAMVKIDFRLVPDLTPEAVETLLRDHLKAQGFDDIEVISMHGMRPAASPVDAPVVQAAIRAAEAVYGQSPVVWPMIPGSGPMAPLTTDLGTPAVLAGIGYPNARFHAPDENVRLADYVEGIKFVGALIATFAEADTPHA